MATIEQLPVKESAQGFPLSSAQERIWFLAQLEPDSPAYNETLLLRFIGELRVDALERAMNEIVRRHEILRTAFRSVAGNPLQFPLPFRPRPLPCMQLPPEPSGAEDHLRRALRPGALQRFELTAGETLRPVLWRISDRDHVLQILAHHIVADGWSMRIFISELRSLYNAFSTGSACELPEPSMQYARYSQCERDQAGELAKSIEYWRGQLADAPDSLDLCTDHPRPARSSYRGGAESIVVSSELLTALKAISKRNGASMFMTALAGLGALLQRYTGQTDILVGSPTAGRNSPAIEQLIGQFTNTVVLRLDTSGDPSFGELTTRARSAVLGALAHQNVPFERLVRELRPTRYVSRQPWFQVMFTYQGITMAQPAMTDLEVRYIEDEAITAKVDLAFSAGERPGGLLLLCQYDADLFDPPTIRRMLQHWRRMLEAMAADPASRLTQPDLLSIDERNCVVREWNRTETEYRSDKCIHELFEEQAEATPDATALVFENRRLTYAQLNAQANRLRDHLRALGVGPEVRVGLCADRSLEMVVALLAILKAGGAYVPMDPEYPRQRLSYILENIETPVVLTEQRLMARFAGARARVVALDSGQPWNASVAGAPPPRVSDQNLAYVIYTSGSTGNPKGAMNAHDGVRNRLLWMQDAYGLTPGDCVLQKTPFTFDVSVWEFFWPLLAGARLVLARPGGHQDPAYLVNLIAREQVTTVHFVPSMLTAFLDRPDVERCSSLKRVICSGEALSKDLQDRFFTRLNCALHNLYGPTEAAVDVTSWECRRDMAESAVPIGRPIANIRMHVLDADLRPVPIGGPGELCIAGVGVGRGYWRSPGLTAEKFVPNPLAESPGERLYRTGDLARYRPDGNLEYLGRIDHQVKIRGFRIEPGEIEAVLRRCPGVRDAAVVVREVASGDKRLVAYIAGEQAPDAGELQARLRERLPAYMIPAAFVALERLPLTASGKLDRKSLPEPVGYPASEHAYLAPRSLTEELLRGVWQHLLGVERIGVRDNFFDLGGHSLLAVQVVSQARKIFGVELELLRVFEAPTIEGLAETLEAARRGSGVEAKPRLAPRASGGEAVMSYAQQRLWAIHQLAPRISAYNVPVALRLRGPLNKAALGAALDEIVRRHQALRTRFYMRRDGVGVQAVEAAPAPILQCTDVSGLSGAMLRRKIAEEALRPFDLGRAPLLRCSLLEVGEQERVLLITMHHIVSDGWSMGVLVRELTTLYEAFSAGRASPLAELPVQYADYAVWQREWLDSGVLEEQLRYWEAQLGGATAVLELPADRPRPAVRSFRGGSCALQTDVELRESLQRISRREGVTLFMTLLASFQVVLHRYTGLDEVVVGTPAAGRHQAQVEDLIGFFVNTLALRTDLSGNPSFRELLGRVRRVAIEGYANQDVPFEKVVERLRPERDLSHNPLFQVMFSYEAGAGERVELAGLEVSPAGEPNQSAKFDLTGFVLDDGRQLRLAAEYNSDLFEASTIERLLEHWRNLLRAVAADAEVRIGEAPLLGAGEREQVVEQWNGAERWYRREQCLHELFEAQVDQRPDAIAVIDDERQWSYRELEARANAVAQTLRDVGVGRGEIVGVCMERGADTVAALLGIVKCGAAYVPLEVNQPAARMASILRTVAARCVVIDGARERGALLREMPGTLEYAICMDGAAGPIESGLRYAPVRREGPRLAAVSDSQDVAYVIFTSGSTGTPKGVMVEHRAVANLIDWVNREYSIGPGDRVLLSSSFGFDLSVYDVFGLLAGGGSVRVASTAALRDPLRLLAMLREEPITFWDSAPAALQQLTPFLSGPPIEAKLRLVFLSGDWIPLGLPDQVRGHFKQARVIALGGATEATVWSNSYAVGAVDAEWSSIPYGKPIQNARYYVLDGHLNPAPIGTPGDLYIGGECLALGYAADARLTAGKFIPDAFGGAGGRLYATGDRARWRPAGHLEFLGRRDTQVKVRGFRIELGEIEAALRQQAGVRDAVAAVREQAGGRRLVGYVTAQTGASLDLPELRRKLSERLPEYMVPGVVLELERLPVTANGKLDRKALPAPTAECGPGAGYAAPRTELQALLCRIWREVLQVERVGIEDNFFELGGDSIQGIRIVAKAQQAGVRINAQQMFEHLTIAELAEHVTASVALEDESGAGTAPLTPIQEWFFAQEWAEPWHYNQSVMLRVPEQVSAEQVEAALAELAARHDALRLRFARQADGSWEQAYAAAEPIRLERIEADPGGFEREATRLQRSLDLEHGPLMRAGWFEVGAGQRRLLLVIHHLVVDGVSWRILLEDLQALCGPNAALPARSSSYGRWAKALREYAEARDWREELSWWEQVGEAGRLPRDADGENTLESAAWVHTELNEEDTRALLQETPRVYRTQIQDALITALLRSMGRWSGNPELLLDVEGHGREEVLEGVDVSRTVGWFSTMYPVRVHRSGADIGEDLKAVKEQLRRIPGRGFSYGVLRWLLRRLGSTAPAEVLFNYLGQFDQVLSGGAWEGAAESRGVERSRQGRRTHVLSVDSHVSGGRLRMSWEYSRVIHNEQSIRAVAQDCIEELRALIAHCRNAEAGYTPSDFPLAGVDAEELMDIVNSFEGR